MKFLHQSKPYKCLYCGKEKMSTVQGQKYCNEKHRYLYKKYGGMERNDSAKNVTNLK